MCEIVFIKNKADPGHFGCWQISDYKKNEEEIYLKILLIESII